MQIARQQGDRNLFGGDRCLLDRAIGKLPSGANREGDRGQISGSIGSIVQTQHLLAQLVSYWKMDDAGGSPTLIDSVGSNNLAGQSGTTGNPVAGMINNAQYFTGAGYWGIGSNASLRTTGDFTWSCWARLDDIAAAGHIIFAKGDAAAVPPWDYLLLWSKGTPSVMQFQVDGTHNVQVAAGSDGAWHNFICWYDSVAGTANIVVDNGAVISAPSGHDDTIGNFFVAAAISTASPFFQWVGAIDELGFWKRVLNPVERTALFNKTPLSGFLP